MPFALIDIGTPFHAEIVAVGGGHHMEVRVGYDLDRGCNYFIETGLRPVATHPSLLEYHFCFLGVDDNSHRERYWSGRDTPKTISQYQRRKILGSVLNATEALLNKVVPKEVLRIAHDPRLPECALAKHTAVTVVFERCGYEIAQEIRRRGRLSWLMKRQN
jgi:hypothetical protein